MDKLDEALTVARARKALPSPAERRRLRVEAGVTQAAIGQALGVSRATVARWESGQRRPGPDHLDQYLDVLSRFRKEIT
jgi:transcriptional regulator with XRE-family HTH domain